MRNFLQNLLMVFALCLCGLCVRQWYFQTVQRNLLAEQGQKIFDRDTAIQGYTNTIQTQDHQIALLDRQLAQLNQSLLSNNDLLILQKHDLARLRADTDTLTHDVTLYTNNIVLLESRLANAYEGIEKLTNDVAQLVAQRDDFITRYNNSVSNYNVLGSNYNNVVDRLNKLQSPRITPLPLSRRSMTAANIPNPLVGDDVRSPPHREDLRMDDGGMLLYRFPPTETAISRDHENADILPGRRSHWGLVM
jgi:hypothetical protein